MTYNYASTAIKSDRPPFAEVTGTAPPEGTELIAQAVPEASPRSDFAASAAMVNDILATRPSGDTREGTASPAQSEVGLGGIPQPQGSEPIGAPPSSDFFASTKTRNPFSAKSKKPTSAEPRKPSGSDSKKPFWQKQLTIRRSRTGA